MGPSTEGELMRLTLPQLKSFLVSRDVLLPLKNQPKAFYVDLAIKALSPSGGGSVLPPAAAAAGVAAAAATSRQRPPSSSSPCPPSDGHVVVGAERLSPPRRPPPPSTPAPPHPPDLPTPAVFAEDGQTWMHIAGVRVPGTGGGGGGGLGGGVVAKSVMRQGLLSAAGGADGGSVAAEPGVAFAPALGSVPLPLSRGNHLRMSSGASVRPSPPPPSSVPPAAVDGSRAEMPSPSRGQRPSPPRASRPSGTTRSLPPTPPTAGTKRVANATALRYAIPDTNRAGEQIMSHHQHHHAQARQHSATACNSGTAPSLPPYCSTTSFNFSTDPDLDAYEEKPVIAALGTPPIPPPPPVPSSPCVGFSGDRGDWKPGASSLARQHLSPRKRGPVSRQQAGGLTAKGGGRDSEGNVGKGAMRTPEFMTTAMRIARGERADLLRKGGGQDEGGWGEEEGVVGDSGIGAWTVAIIGLVLLWAILWSMVDTTRLWPKPFCTDSSGGINGGDNCIPCPSHGWCKGGILMCEVGYERVGNRCVKDKRVEQIAQRMKAPIVDFVCQKRGSALCGRPGGEWITEGDVLELLEQKGLRDQVGKGRENYQLVFLTALQRAADVLETRADLTGLQSFRCPHKMVSKYKPTGCIVREWARVHWAVLIFVVPAVVACGLCTWQAVKRRRMIGRAACVYEQVCSYLEEHAMDARASSTPENTCPWVVASRLRDYLLPIEHRKDHVLWKEVLTKHHDSVYVHWDPFVFAN
ncbi:hypothetical protein CBR_g18557 [Chara braunii]|uniref:Man1/Src1-like C-terminal domain-containing protein n=1 Tax=Chara braunii TaxID=69332 RepID=A0A388JT28_CHABU|nr:hypothetical protein CBR_g18557 [Chara braunii]|eukprot:GBG60958.1 hypothetical protein CBR_g18557 [Chara braunii]